MSDTAAPIAQDGRIHGLDAARASMMLMGVLLHYVILAGLFMDTSSTK